NDFGYSDVDGDAFYLVKITALPGTGNIRYNGANIALSGGSFTVTVADIDAGKLSYLSGSNGSFGFTYQVQETNASGLFSATATTTFAVSTNSPPSVAVLQTTPSTYTELGTAVTVDSVITTIDPGSHTVGATVTIGNFV